MRRLALLAVAALFGFAASVAEAKPRVASINVCTDQLLLALADDDQIASLSAAAKSPRASFHVDRAMALGAPENRATVEEALLLRPDMVFLGAWDAPARDALHRFGVRVESFDDPRTLDDVAAQIRRAGELLDQPERAAAAVARLDAARARAAAHRLRGKRAVVFYTGGYTYGSGSLMHDMLGAFGLVNIAAEAGVEGVGRIDIETLVGDRPDIILTDDAIARGAPRVDTQVLEHPALKRAIPGADPVRFPLRYWICGVEAAAALDFMVERLR